MGKSIAAMKSLKKPTPPAEEAEPTVEKSSSFASLDDLVSEDVEVRAVSEPGADDDGGDPEEPAAKRSRADDGQDTGGSAAASGGGEDASPTEIETEGLTAHEVADALVATLRASARSTFDGASLADTLCARAARDHAGFKLLCETYAPDAPEDDLREVPGRTSARLAPFFETLIGTVARESGGRAPFFSEVRTLRDDGLVPAFRILSRLNYVAYDHGHVYLRDDASTAAPARFDADTPEGFTVLGLLEAAAAVAPLPPNADDARASIAFAEIAENSHQDYTFDLKFAPLESN